MRKRVVLLSGMGSDRRFLDRLQIPGITVHTPDHLPPIRNESLAAYAAKVAREHAIEEGDVVGGASFGGMLAAEIAGSQRVAGLILLGSCIRPRCLPRSYRWIERIGPLIPDAFLGVRSLSVLLRWRLGPLTEEAEALLVAMARDCPVELIREFARMAVRWDGAPAIGCPVLSIHGDRDRIIPLRCAEDGVILRDAGHAFPLTHAPQTVEAIQRFLARDLYFTTTST